MSDVETTGGVGASRTYGAIVWGQLRKRPSAMVSLGVIVLLALVAILAPFIAGEVPIRWVENGRVSWPIFRYLSNGEYAAMLGFALALLAPLTVRLLRRRAHRTGTGGWRWVFLAHLAIWLVVSTALVAWREPERRYGFYLGAGRRGPSRLA